MRSLAAGALAYVFMDWRHIGDLIAVGHIVFGEMINLCVWAKGNAGQGSFYRSQRELVEILSSVETLIVTTSSSAGLDEIQQPLAVRRCQQLWCQVATKRFRCIRRSSQ